MATYLFTWNPARWDWTYLQDSIAEVRENGYCSESWSCGVTKKIRTDDRAFLMKLGVEPRGIIASGWVTSDVYEGRHWDRDKKAKSKTALYVDVDWDTLLDPEIDIFPRVWLDSGAYSRMHWEPQASGVRIPDEIAAQLEKDWAKFLDRPATIREMAFAEEIDTTRTYAEGATRQVTVNVYERNAKARAICVIRYGPNCSACGFNFGRTYGETGEGFIHVHHLKPLAEAGKGYKLNPIRDLRPVCPNCHAMLHQRKPAYSIEELKTIIKRAAQ
jgi:5-methylcytosine-specific restriction protein A